MKIMQRLGLALLIINWTTASTSENMASIILFSLMSLVGLYLFLQDGDE